MIKHEKDLVESEDFPGFYHHPTIESIVISKSGRVIDLRGKCCPLPYLGSNGYISVNVRGFGTETVHRLLAQVFLTEPLDIDDPIVNHIDGIKVNNLPHNLEWTCHSGNLIHAYETGLRTDNRPVLVQCILTGEKLRFNSLQETGRYFKTNTSEVFRYLNSDSMVPWRKRFEMTYEGKAFKGLTAEDIGKVANGQSKEVVVNRDGFLIIFSSISDASRALGISLYRLYGALSKGTAVGDVTISYMDEYEGDTSQAEVRKGHRSTVVRPNFKRLPTPIQTIDQVTGEKLYWNSCEELARIYGVTKSAIQRAISVNAGRWRNFHVEYVKKLSPTDQ